MNDNLIPNLLTILTWLLFISAGLVPIVLILFKASKSKSYETNDLALKLFFLLFLLTIISYFLQKFVSNPIGWKLYLLSGTLGIIVLAFFFFIALLQIRMVRGKGAAKRFFRRQQH